MLGLFWVVLEELHYNRNNSKSFIKLLCIIFSHRFFLTCHGNTSLYGILAVFLQLMSVRYYPFIAMCFVISASANFQIQEMKTLCKRRKYIFEKKVPFQKVKACD